MSTGFTEPVVHGTRSNQASYPYRSGCGFAASQEHSVFFDDFYLNPTSNAVPGTTAIIDTGATITAAATDVIGKNGALAITSDGTTEGATMYWPNGIQLGGGGKFFMEVRVKTLDADDTDVQFGLSVMNATTNPEDAWTTAATDLIAFGVLDGDATVTMLCDKNNGGAAANLGTIDLSDSTWHVLAIEVSGTAANSSMSVRGYVDGQLAITWDVETEIPDDLVLAPFIGARTGADANHIVYWDYVRWSHERVE